MRIAVDDERRYQMWRRVRREAGIRIEKGRNSRIRAISFENELRVVEYT